MVRLALVLLLTMQPWLVFSDLHFDPFAQPHLVDRLAAAPPDRWREIFASAKTSTPSATGTDTNDKLLELALEGARNAVPDPRVVIVDGDFLADNFRAKFDRTAKVHDDAAYDAFVDKTIAFLAWELEAAFPRAQFLPVIGDDDGYCGEYASTPRDPFLAHMAADWAASVGVNDPAAFIAQFSTGGYYTVPLPIYGAQAIVLNDVFWSAQYKNTCGDPKADPGGEELAWLNATVSAIHAGQPVWIITHIPPGIDVAASARAGSAVPFLADRFNAGLIDAISQHPAVVMSIAAHTHMDSFRVIGPDPSTPRAPMLVVPSVSPISGSIPAFTVLDVDSQSAQVDDKAVFMLTKTNNAWSWTREYDFDSIFGHGTIDVTHLWNAQQSIFQDERVRRRFEQYYRSGDGAAPITEGNWRDYWCANVALTATAYTACAMPQAQRDTETHPSPPPTPMPTATPRPTPAPTASPSPSPSPRPT